MKKLLIAAALFCTLSTQAQNAQEMKKKTPQERADRMSKVMEKKLNLDANQAAQIRKINADGAVKMEAQMSQNQKDRTQMKALRENQEAQYKQVLTPDQMVSYQQMKADRMAKHKAHMAENGNRRMQPARMNNDGGNMQQTPPADR